MQRLGIVSDCIHFKNADGKIGTENHILLQQLQALATHFSSVVICCPFVAFDDKKVASFYTDERISFISVPNVGGNSITDKLKMLFVIPKWLAAFKKVDALSDVVYQRFPNNLNLPGFFYFHLKRKKVFATFTGTWDDYAAEPKSYLFQKKLLRKYFRGPVWAYLDKPSTNPKIHAGFSPSYSNIVWDEETEQVNKRLQKLKNSKLETLKLITVGAFVANKNQQLILDACLLLRQQHIPFTLTLVGDGILKDAYQIFIDEYQLNNQIFIAGKKTSTELRELYRQNDFVVQAPIYEGFGKVPIEGFFHGLIPVLSNVELAKVMVANGERGYVFEQNNVESLVNILVDIYQNQSELINQIILGRGYAKSQTLEAWANDYAATVASFYK
ncbi:MAG: glycosyltransferase family 4 protein [Pedobacter sp.]|nr:glycosyltransferase family 4 protein [Chitinophagaceae bacterium]